MLMDVVTRSVKPVSVILILPLFFVFGCNPDPGRADILLKANLKDLAFRKKIEDITIYQVVRRDGHESRVSEFHKGDKYLMKAVLPGDGEGSNSEGFILSDGDKNAWIVIPAAGSITLGEKERSIYVNRNIFWWELPLEPFELLGRTESGGRRLIGISFRENRDIVYDELWVDETTLAPVKALGVDGEGRNFRIIWSDFNVVGGEFELPFRTEMAFENGTATTIQILNVYTNTGLPDDLFHPDSALDALDAMRE